MKPLLVAALLALSSVAVQSESTQVVESSMGFSHSMVLTDDGTLWGTGRNNRGQLGIGSTANQNNFVLVATGVRAVSAGNEHTAYIANDGTLWMMGSNSRGQLATGDTEDRLSPVAIASEVFAVSAGGAHTVFIKNDHTLWTVGSNAAGQGGGVDRANQLSPVKLDDDVWAASAGGGDFTVYLKRDGTLWGIGNNYYRQLNSTDTVSQSAPVFIAANVTGVVAGGTSHVFTKRDGTLWGMGDNSSGQTTSVAGPRQLDADGIVLGSSYTHSFYVRSDGALRARGYYALGTGIAGGSLRTVDTQVVGMSAGGWPSAVHFLKQDGSLWGVGENGYGQLGDGSNASRADPVLLAAAFSHTLSPPANVAASQGTVPNVVALTWEPVFGAAYYEIWRGVSANSENAAQIGRATAPLYPDNQVVAGETYHYWVRAVGAGGSSLPSIPVTGGMQDVLALPVITQQPVYTKALANVPARIGVTVSSAGPVSYQWQQHHFEHPTISMWENITDGAVFSGAQTAQLTIEQPLEAYRRFRCVVTNAAGSVISDQAQFDIIYPPAILLPLTVPLATADAGAVINVTVDGYHAPELVWQRRAVGTASWSDLSAGDDVLIESSLFGTNVRGKLTLSNVTAQMNGDQFRVVATNDAGALTSDPVTLTVDNAGVIQALARAGRSFFLKANGTLWATNPGGLLPVLGPDNESYPSLVATDVARVDASSGHVLVLKTDGTLWGVGANNYGQLGDGTTTVSSVFKLIANDVVYMSAADNQTAYVTKTGELWQCGRSLINTLGSPSVLTPALLATDVAFVAAAPTHVLLIKLDGTLQGVGYTYGQQVPPNDGINPKDIASGVTFAATDGLYSLFVTTDQTLWGLGSNSFGVLGVPGLYPGVFLPMKIASQVETADARSDGNIMIRNGGEVWVIGHFTSGWRGPGDLSNSTSTPLQVTTNAMTASVGATHSLVTRADGSLWGIGSPGSTTLGLGPFSGHPSADYVTELVPITTGIVTPPAQVGELQVTTTLSSRVMLSWSLALGAEFYEVWRGESGDFASAARIASGLRSPLFSDRSAIPGTNYHYWVKAVNRGGTSSAVGMAEGMATNADPVITEQPPRFVIPDYMSATTSLTVVATGTPVLTYQWQSKGGWEQSWADMVDNPDHSGTNTATLSLRENGRRYLDVLNRWYRCVVSGPAGSAVSAPTQFVEANDAQLYWENPSPIVYGTPLSAVQLNAAASVAGVFTYNPPLGNTPAAGVQSLYVTFTPSSSSYRTVDTSRTLVVHRAEQTIAFPTIQNREFTTEPISLNASSSSGLAIEYAVISGPAEVNGNSLTLLDAGEVTVRAFQPGDSNYLFAEPVDQTFTVNPISSTVTLSGLTAVYTGSPQGVTATTAPEGLTVSITYDESGEEPVAPGSYDVAATVTSAGYTGSATGTFTITQSEQTITFLAVSDTTYTATPIVLTASASSDLGVTFSIVSGPATISGNQLTLTGTGTVTVRASQAGNENYLAATPVERSFTVTANGDSWAAEHFTSDELADPLISGPSADPDRDGLTNLLEYALGLDPKSSDTTGLPEVGSTSTDWTYTYTRPTDRADLVYDVEVSTDLESWTTSGVTMTKIYSADSEEVWQATYPLSAAPTLFFRLKVVQE